MEVPCDSPDTVTTKAVSSKILYMEFYLFMSVVNVCVLCESKSGCWRTLAVSVMVIVCQNLRGAAQQDAVCVCVHISAGKGRAGPTVHVSTAKSSALLIQPSRDVFVFLTVLVYVCAFEELQENCCHKVGFVIL